MDWSPEQDRALKKIENWWRFEKDRQQVFRLFGFAGTGKTTLAQEIERMLGIQMVFATFTGKAAQVLRSKGCENATTIHSLIYQVKEKSRTRLDELEQALLEAAAEGSVRRVEELKVEIKNEKKNLSNPSFSLGIGSAIHGADAICIDEVSMVDTAMGVDLLSFRKPIIVLGDPAQLPPIMGGGYFTENCTPDVMLTEIHRQARDNPIIHLATRVRQGDRLDFGTYGQSKIVRGTDLERGEALLYDQVLVGKNVTRRRMNNKFRDAKGFVGMFPQPGEKLIGLRNNHDKGLLNGSMWECVEALPSESEHFLISVSSLDGSGLKIDTSAHKFPFTGEECLLPWWERKEADEFDHGYAITVHKSQGSQYSSVMLLDEWFKADSRKEWLYTAITRAADRITIVRS